MKAKNLILILIVVIVGCSSKESESPETGKVGEWVNLGNLSVMVEKADLEDFYNPMDKTGMTLGMPRFKVKFLVRNNIKRKVSIDMVECDFRDGDGRHLGQVIFSGSNNIIKPGEWRDFSTDTNGYHLNPEVCKLFIKPYCEGFSGRFVFDISKKLNPKRSESERKRRERLDEFDPLLKKRK